MVATTMPRRQAWQWIVKSYSQRMLGIDLAFDMFIKLLVHCYSVGPNELTDS